MPFLWNPVQHHSNAGELQAPIVPEILRDGDAANFGRFTESADAEVAPPLYSPGAADSFFQDWLLSAKSGAGMAGDAGQWRCPHPFHCTLSASCRTLIAIPCCNV